MKREVPSCAAALATAFLMMNFTSCSKKPSAMSDETQITNHLIHESSPYLLQHAHNPVEWYPWGEAAWAKAKKENKLVLVSIGYSSCHWCHVMERESFEDTAVAAVMNEHFICIKVDREERPDVDQVYMAAVQLMTGGGGWPLNCITLPDGRPVYGGTYFPKERWKNLLLQLAAYYEENPKEAESYASRLTEGIQMSELVRFNDAEAAFYADSLVSAVAGWSSQFDAVEGGNSRAPKFPMPNNYEFLLRYASATDDETALKHATLTLDKMAFGGIYDQVGGGFARYATDSVWKVPHFEKMLYDNAQLVSLYSMAYQLTKSELYRQVVYETCEFIRREMTAPDGGCYSALDADSEGEEGKFYVWKNDELQAVLGDLYPAIAAYFNVNENGLWENGNYILLRKQSDEQVARKFGDSVEELRQNIAEGKKLLLQARSKRIRPGLDDKQLTSWNALMIKAYCDAFNAFGDGQFLTAALTLARHNWNVLWQREGGYIHSYKPTTARQHKSGKSEGRRVSFLEDYSFSAEAFIALYQCTFDERWLQRAGEIASYAMVHFQDPESKMFFFTSDLDAPLITRKMEIHDNVIPSSNSSMAKALFALSIYLDDEAYRNTATQMLHNVQQHFLKYPSGHSNWMALMMRYTFPFNEVVITGTEAMPFRDELASHFLPHVLLAGSETATGRLSLLQNRYVPGKTLIYVCKNRSCKLPVEDVSEALKLLKTQH